MGVSLLLQDVLVGVVVAASALFSLWRLLSLPLRLRWLEALAALPGAGHVRVLASLRERTLAQLQSGCAACASHPAATPGAAARNRTPGALRR